MLNAHDAHLPSFSLYGDALMTMHPKRRGRMFRLSDANLGEGMMGRLKSEEGRAVSTGVLQHNRGKSRQNAALVVADIASSLLPARPKETARSGARSPGLK